MPRETFNNSGNWTAPFATNYIRAGVTGGGGSGHNDDDDDEEGAGGGGAGWSRSTANDGDWKDTLGFSIGDGGNPPSDGSRSGESSNVSFRNENGQLYRVGEAGGGEGGNDDDGGGGGGAGGGQEARSGQSGTDDDGNQEGGGAGGCGRCGGNRRGGRGIDPDGDCNNNCGGNDGRDPGGGGGGGNDDGAGRGGDGRGYVEWEYADPDVSLNLSNNSCSPAGNPNYSYTVTVNAKQANKVNVSGIGTVSNTAAKSQTINLTRTGPQSNCGNNSPANRSHSATASGPGGNANSGTKTISFQNDRTPNSISISTTTQGGALSLTAGELEPDTWYASDNCTFGGTDMPVKLSSSASKLKLYNSSGGRSSEITVGKNGVGNNSCGCGTKNFRYWVKSPVFNTSRTPGGVNDDGLAIGQTNSASYTLSWDDGTTRTITVTTRAPVIEEIFNFEGPTNVYPNPDIDTVPGSPSVYIQTGNDVTCNDVEIDVEIKVDDPDAQARINSSGGWKDMREI